MPNDRHSSSCLLVLGSDRHADRSSQSRDVGLRRTEAASRSSTGSSEGGVRQHGSLRVEPAPPQRIAEHAARLGEDQARGGEVPDRSEREDRGVDLGARHPHRVEHDALAPRRVGLAERVSRFVAPADHESGPRHHHHGRRVDVGRIAAPQRRPPPTVERTVLAVRRHPRATAARRPPPAPEARRRHDADDYLAVDLECDRRRPPGRPRA